VPCEAEPLESLGRCHLVHEVEVDEQHIGSTFGVVDHVGVPDLVE
jgi:hypothetical protein